MKTNMVSIKYRGLEELLILTGLDWSTKNSQRPVEDSPDAGEQTMTRSDAN